MFEEECFGTSGLPPSRLAKNNNPTPDSDRMNRMKIENLVDQSWKGHRHCDAHLLLDHVHGFKRIYRHVHSSIVESVLHPFLMSETNLPLQRRSSLCPGADMCGVHAIPASLKERRLCPKPCTSSWAVGLSDKEV